MFFCDPNPGNYANDFGIMVFCYISKNVDGGIKIVIFGDLCLLVLVLGWMGNAEAVAYYPSQA